MKRLLLILALLATPASAQTSAEELRARDIGHQLRCVVCRNESIEESDAELAVDMRRIVRERIAAGESNGEVVAYMRERYGDYVLLKPPIQSNTYVLWFLPAALIVLSLVWFGTRAKRRESVQTDIVMTEDDRRLLKRLMEEDR